MREYMRRKRSASQTKPSCTVLTCSFCGEAGSDDRLLVGDEDCIIRADCITLAVARIAVGGDNTERAASVPRSFTLGRRPTRKGPSLIARRTTSLPGWMVRS
jgi:hypothetical protein